jgi:ATP-dependent Clp protease ATP-binding subunit ClpB
MENEQKKIDELNKVISELSEERNDFRSKWDNEKNKLDHIQNMKKEMEDAKLEAERAEREGNYGRVAELRYGKIKELGNNLKNKEALVLPKIGSLVISPITCWSVG